jgi:O-antigen/teichoic acid export membrane protein
VCENPGAAIAQEVSAADIPHDTKKQRDFVSTVARNSAFVIGVQVVMKALAFLFNIYIVRRLGDEHFGRYAAVMAFIAIFAIFSDLGMAPYMLREIARDRKSIYWLLPNVIVMRILLSGIVVIVATLTALTLGKEQDMVLGIFIAACGLFLYAVQGPLDSVLMAWERLDYSASFTLVSQLIFWGLGTLFLVTGWGFVGLLIASLTGVACMALLQGLIVFRRIEFRKLRLSARRWGELAKSGLPFGISGLSFSLQGRFDSVLLSMTLTDAAVGWYNVPLQLTQMLMLLAQSVCTSLLPSLTRAHSIDPKSIYGIVHRALKYLLTLSLPIAVGGTILADKLIITLYSEEFVNSILLMRILIWTLPLMFIAELMGALIIVLRKERAGARVNVLNAAISVGLDLVLVTTVGVTGAAVARVSARGIRTGQYWRLLGSELLVGKRWREIVRVVLAAAGMGVGVFFLREMNLFLTIGIGAVLYLALLFVFRAIGRDELENLLALLLRRERSKSPYGA